jgi:hypothetical protein
MLHGLVLLIFKLSSWEGSSKTQAIFISVPLIFGTLPEQMGETMSTVNVVLKTQRHLGQEAEKSRNAGKFRIVDGRTDCDK